MRVLPLRQDTARNVRFMWAAWDVWTAWDMWFVWFLWNVRDMLGVLKEELGQ